MTANPKPCVRGVTFLFDMAGLLIHRVGICNQCHTRTHTIKGPISQISQCTHPLYHNTHIRTDMCTFLFRMAHLRICNRCTLGSDNLVCWHNSNRCVDMLSGQLCWRKHTLCQAIFDAFGRFTFLTYAVVLSNAMLYLLLATQTNKHNLISLTYR